ncbi:MAG: DUF86 domain-containing protein [Bacteroidales bacterium]|nr:DUF86 domain-containing protein [Bacteroidales bacterium]
MREPVRDKGRLEHMMTAIDNVFEYTKNVSFDGLGKDKILCHAVIYNIQIIGEAAFKLTKEFRDAHLEVDWRDVIAMRHILVHDYYEVNLNILWNVITEELPFFKIQIESIIKEME